MGAALALIRPLFDAALYQRNYRDVPGDDEQLLQHFCTRGWQEGRNPNAAFDTAGYLRRYPDVAGSGLNPFYHFLFAGEREYRQADPAIMPAAVAQIAFGFDPGDWVDLMRPAIDEPFYIAQLGPAFDGSFDPAAHYCYRGWLDGLDPNPDFSVRNALALWPSLRLERLNPLLARLAPPAAAAAQPDPPDDRLQSTRFERTALFGIGERLASLQAAHARPWLHSADRAARYHEAVEQVVASALDPDYYLATNQDVAQAGVDPVRHFCSLGWAERRDPAPWFDTGYYLDANGDVASLGLNPLWHYLNAGRLEGRPARQPGGVRRAIIDAAVDPDVITANYGRAAPGPKLSRSWLEKRLQSVCAAAKGLALSVGHDCYIRVTGGIQICIADEQARFAGQGIAYLNLSPLQPRLRLADPGEAGQRYNLVLDGAFLGVVSHADLAAALQTIKPRKGERRLFLVHCVLGHHVAALVALHQASASTSSVFWVHDYSSICTGYTLLRNDMAFCKAPPVGSVACRVCVHGPRRSDHQSQLRLLFETIAFHVVAPSEAALDIWLAHAGLPHLSARAHPHCELAPLPQPAARLVAKGPVRLGFIGYTKSHKGWPLWQELARRTGQTGAYEFLHFGSAETASKTPGMQHHLAATTPEQPRAMIDALAEQQVDLVLGLSTWPETFSYASFEALAAGADLVCLADSGNVAAAVLRLGRGVVAADEESLLAFFESLRAVEYVRLCREQMTPRGQLLHRGTSATLDIIQ